NPPARVLDALIVVTMRGVRSRAAQVRPQLFSLLLFSVLLTILTDVDRRGDRRVMLLIAPLIALWANLHGGWIVGLECLVTWAGCNLLLGPPSASDDRGRDLAPSAQRIVLVRSEEHTSELQSHSDLVCRLLLE